MYSLVQELHRKSNHKGRYFIMFNTFSWCHCCFFFLIYCTAFIFLIVLYSNISTLTLRSNHCSSCSSFLIVSSQLTLGLQFQIGGITGVYQAILYWSQKQKYQKDLYHVFFLFLIIRRSLIVFTFCCPFQLAATLDLTLVFLLLF